MDKSFISLFVQKFVRLNPNIDAVSWADNFLTIPSIKILSLDSNSTGSKPHEQNLSFLCLKIMAKLHFK